MELSSAEVLTQEWVGIQKVKMKEIPGLRNASKVLEISASPK